MTNINLPPVPESFQRPTQEELDNLAIFIAEQNAIIVARELAEIEKQNKLSQPLTPLPIEGNTVEEIQASAQASVDDLAQQMQERLNLIINN